MQLSLKALAIAFGLLWGGLLLMVGLIHLAAPSYGSAFLYGMSSVYPGFRATGTFFDVLVGTIYGTIDGAVAGAIFGWLYNCFARA